MRRCSRAHGSLHFIDASTSLTLLLASVGLLVAAAVLATVIRPDAHRDASAARQASSSVD
ncbi:hypothetical protein [Burkholderia ambifaria]|uniref:hypothetical protein n=1 Tax=Burkholderia ambifaria TaxID=152480 RepID=UPI00158A4183|nr:hypothetical protein [Burkholderia ambifaria]